MPRPISYAVFCLKKKNFGPGLPAGAASGQSRTRTGSTRVRTAQRRGHSKRSWRGANGIGGFRSWRLDNRSPSLRVGFGISPKLSRSEIQPDFDLPASRAPQTRSGVDWRLLEDRAQSDVAAPPKKHSKRR